MMTEAPRGEGRAFTIDYLPLVNIPLPEHFRLPNGELIFTESQQIAFIIEDNRSAQFPAYECRFRSSLGAVSDFSFPIARFPDFRIRYIGSQDGLFILPVSKLADPITQVIGFDPRQLSRIQYGLVHEQGHAFLNWNRLRLKLMKAALSGHSDALPSYPNIDLYCQAVADIPGIRELPIPQTDLDADRLLEENEALQRAVALFEERFAWGVGLALSTRQPGYVEDRLDVAGLEAAGFALVRYAVKYEDIRFNNGFSREDSIGHLRYFFEQEIQG